MATPTQILSYLRNCYEADNREATLFDFFDDGIRHRIFVSGRDELLTGLFPRVVIDSEKGRKALRAAQLSGRDHSLIAGAFFLVGKPPPRGELPTKICAPLVLFPASIEEEDSISFLSVDFSRQRLNFPVLARLLGESDSNANYLEDIYGRMPEAPYGSIAAADVMSLLDDFLPEVSGAELFRFPELTDEEEITGVLKSSGRKRRPDVRCLPACAVALVRNSPEARGVLAEMKTMVAGAELSRPLGVLLDDEDPKGHTESQSTSGCVPAVLSRAQQRVLDSASHAPLTLIVGPPGTGKSYTIAALALDHLFRGETVLIASRMNHAVDVVGRKIETLLGTPGCVVRGGRKHYLSQLKDFLEAVLQGMHSSDEPSAHDLPSLERRFAALGEELAEIEREFTRRGRWEYALGTRRTRRNPITSVTRWVHRAYVEWRISGSREMWALARDYEATQEERTDVVATLLEAAFRQRITDTLENDRRTLMQFLGVIRARSGHRQGEIFSEMDLKVLLRVFPIWLVSFSDVHRVLPFERELFDVAIIDEATQCDMASALPVFQRARRVAVTGDPKQLRHISFLPGHRQAIIADREALTEAQRKRYDYRNRSLLDVMDEALTRQNQVGFLDEHFRSMPPIIRFSNREFYRDRLKVMTARPETLQRKSVILRTISGRRESKGPNVAEADAIEMEIRRWVDSEASLGKGVCHSFGVLSPFRPQVDYLRARLENALPGAAVDKHDLLVGSAHTFQGEERDVMFISLVVDPESHSGSIRFLNKPDVFNVAITRARSVQYVFLSIPPEEVKSGSLLRRYVEDIRWGSTVAGESSATDPWLARVTDALRTRGFRTWPSYTIAGVEVDLVVEKHDRTVGVDLIGFPGSFARALDLERYRMFQRAGLRLFPLTRSSWLASEDTCIKELESWLAAGVDDVPSVPDRATDDREVCEVT